MPSPRQSLVNTPAQTISHLEHLAALRGQYVNAPHPRSNYRLAIAHPDRQYMCTSYRQNHYFPTFRRGLICAHSRNQLASVATAATLCVLAKSDCSAHKFPTPLQGFDKWRSGNWEARVGYALQIEGLLLLGAMTCFSSFVPGDGY